MKNDEDKKKRNNRNNDKKMMIQRKEENYKKIRISVLTEIKMINTLCYVVIDNKAKHKAKLT